MFVAFAVESAAAVTLGLFIANSRRQVSPTPQVALQPRPTSRSPLEWWRSLRGLFLQIDPKLRVTYAALVFATFASFLFRQGGFQGLLPVFAAEQLGLSATQIGLLFSIAGVIVFAFILPVGFILDKLAASGRPCRRPRCRA